ncbi:MAG: cyclase family protein [Dehalococcoidia bacterium]
MKIYDISVAIHADMHVYPGDPDPIVESWASLANGATAEMSRLSIGTHTGTHIDAPGHFLPAGPRVDQIDLSALIGPAQVVDLSRLEGKAIEPQNLGSSMPAGVERLLLKTRNSDLWRGAAAQQEFAALTPEAAEWFVRRRIRLLGIDYLSIAPFLDPGPVHRILLAGGVVILEGLDLSSVPAGSYTLLCLPLRLSVADGAPARAVLLADGDASSLLP